MEDWGQCLSSHIAMCSAPSLLEVGQFAKCLILREVPVSLQLFEISGSCCLRPFQLQWCTERYVN